MAQITGIDLNENAAARAKQLKAAGISFVARYYKVTVGSHPLTRAEAEALSAAGLYIVSVWENGYPTSYNYFSEQKGIEDGKNAHACAERAGQPHGTVIYAAVDFDAALPMIVGNINAYFNGFAAGLAQAAGGTAVYKLGVYGSGLVCEWLRKHNPHVSFAWMAQSEGWADYSHYTGWNIKQGIGKGLFGLDVDMDQTRGNGGGWRLA